MGFYNRYLCKVLLLSLFLLISKCSAKNNTGSTSFQWLMNAYDPHYFDNFIETKINETCRKDVEKFVSGLKQEEPWAVKMSDSSGRYSSQFFFGNDLWLGSKTLCTELSLSKTTPYPLNFHIARLKVKLSNSLTPKERLIFLGLCFPSSCTSDDLTKILNNQFNSTNIPENSQITVIRVRQVPGHYNLLKDKKFLALGGSILVVCFFICFGTLTEIIINKKKNKKPIKNGKIIVRKNNEKEIDIENNNGKKHTFDIKNKINIYTITGKEILEKVKEKDSNRYNQNNLERNELEKKSSKNFVCQFLLSFSILSNSSKILSGSTSSEDSLNSVHGLRFLSFSWVVLVHTYLQIFAIGENKGLRAVTEKNFAYQLVGNATYSVDSFLVISGLLVSYLFFKNKTAKIEIESFLKSLGKFFTLVLYRFVRLTPVYITVLGIVHITMSFLRDQTVFETPLILQLNCDSYWWRNILYINNFYPRREMCMLWSWYMATDTQFFVLSVILLLLAKRYFKFSVVVLFTLLLSSWCTTAYIAYTYQYQVKVQEPFALFDELYDKPWTRIGPYIIGMCAGWLLAEKKCQIKMPWIVVILGWILSFGGLFGLVFCIRNGLGVAESSIYAALGHTAWGLTLVWIVVACRCGYGGWINTFLSWPAFYPFSRLTYCAYLSHPIIMFLTNYVMDGPFHMHNGVVMIVFLGNLISSYILSFALSLAFEAPFMRLLKLILSPQEKR